MINVQRTRQLYESYAGPERTQSGGRVAFVNLLRHQLGLCDKNGNDHKDRAGNRVLRESTMAPEEFATDELAQAIMGPEVVAWFHSRDRLARAIQHRALIESQFPGDSRALLEATGVGIDVSAFANINAWTAVVGGLIEVKILEAWQNPMFIGDEFCPPEPTKLNGQKVIGTGRLGNKAEFRRPGQKHARAQFGERWIQTPETKERALAVDIYKEAAFWDLTGEVLRQGGDVGEWLRYQKELAQMDELLGVTNTYVYNGVAYLTYLAVDPFPAGQWLNDFSNELNDWLNVQEVMLKFSRMTDPTTNTRVLIMPDVVVVMPGKEATAHLILDARETETRTTANTTQATAPVLQVRRTDSNPYKGKFKKVLTSPLLEQRATDADGLNLSLANATKWWWALQSGKVFKYMQNWPLTVSQAPATNYEMLDQGIISSYFANERGIPSTWEPRGVVRSKH